MHGARDSPRGYSVYLNSWKINMDIFSEDLFNVFEEKSEPAKGKKRKRNEQKAEENGAGPSDEAKKVKVDTEIASSGASTANSTSISSEVKKAFEVDTAESQESDM